ncbi:MAG: beta-ketoacyl-ACP synthase II [Anaerolineae bacterium]|nr:beta-ketoacyl-ACP synthase II [Anaerolineae bacterium]
MSDNNHHHHALRQRVVITGMGCLSPIGNTTAETWDGLISGKQGLDYISLFDTKDIAVKIGGEVKGFEPTAHFGVKEARRMDRSQQLALAATKEALTDANLKIDESNAADIGVITGSGIGGVGTTIGEFAVMMQRGPRRVSPYTVPMMMPDGAAGLISIMYGARGPNMNVTTACASANNAMGESFEMIASGRCKMVITGGLEASILPFPLVAFDNMGALSGYNSDPKHASRPFDKTRNGFVTGEGAGIFVFESLSSAQARGAKIYAEVVGYGSTADAKHITAPDPNGAAMAMRLAMKQAGIQASQVDYIAAHGTSTPLNDASETKAIKFAFGEAAHTLKISSNKGAVGHLLGAAGVINVVACIGALNHGIVPPTINFTTADPDCDLNYVPNTAIHAPVNVAMSNAFGFGGHNATLIFKKF